MIWRRETPDRRSADTWWFSVVMRQLAVLACKLLGIYALLTALMVGSTAFWDATRDLGMFLVSVLPSVSLAIVGIGLLTFADGLGRLLTRGAADGESTVLEVAPGFEVVGIALLGLFDLVTSVPGLIIQALVMLLRDEFEVANSFGAYAPGLIGSVLRVALGLWLVLGARGWSNGLRQLRNTGLQPNERPWPPGPDDAESGSEHSNG